MTNTRRSRNAQLDSVVRPCWAGSVIVQGKQLSVRLPDRIVTAQAPAALLRLLADRCDGTLALTEVLAACMPRWPRERVKVLLAHLLDEQALIDQQRLAQHMLQIALQPWQTGSPPSAGEISAWTIRKQHASVRHASGSITPTETALLKLIRSRRSARRFMPTGIARDQLVGVLCASYGVVPQAAGAAPRRTVPCAGALPALSLHVIVRRPGEGLDAGIYRAIFNGDGGVSLKAVRTDTRSFPSAFHAYAAVREAPVVLVLSADLSISAFKYGEKALLYVPLEAGHATQNAMLAATDAGLHTVEVGGFAHRALSRLLKLSAQQTLLTTVAIGYGAAGLPAEMRGPIPITTCWVDEPFSSLRIGFHVVSASGPYGTVAWGRDSDPELAYRKALFEMNERLACSTLGHTVGPCRRSQLAGALDPRQFIRYTDRQFRQAQFPYAPFSENAHYLWVGAERSTGERAWITSDLVYFRRALPRGLQRRTLCAATSSGVAAATDRATARLRALLEGIERDAFMFWWMVRRPPPAHDNAPGRDIELRLARMRAAGLRIRLLDLTLDTVPVAAVWVQSSLRHYTTLGLGADFDMRGATLKALSEVESQVHIFEAGKGLASIQSRDVVSAEHHLALYNQRRHYRRADWFARGGERLTPAKEVRSRRVIDEGAALIALLESQRRAPLFVDLDAPVTADQPFHACRALVPGLLPMSFGYDMEPWGNVREIFHKGRVIATVSFKSQQASFPHPFA